MFQSFEEKLQKIDFEPRDDSPTFVLHKPAVILREETSPRRIK